MPVQSVADFHSLMLWRFTGSIVLSEMLSEKSYLTDSRSKQEGYCVPEALVQDNRGYSYNIAVSAFCEELIHKFTVAGITSTESD